MVERIPRVVIAGTNSGCGKTTVTCAILEALMERGLRPGAFKCGPDYIDPMFHREIIGAKSGNLDLFLCGADTVRTLLGKGGADRGLCVIEGVMGYYDGLELTSTEGSTYETAAATESPVVLVADAKGAALSVLAVIGGFLAMVPDSRIAGVILNRCSPMTYPRLAEAIRNRFPGVRPLGYMPPMPDCALESRHLGLVTAAEVSGLRQKLRRLAAQAEESVELGGLLELGRSAVPLRWEPLKVTRFPEPVPIAVARDRAFCFYYEDGLDLLREMGAELVEFSPLEDSALPEGICGLYLGGGYPELYAERLAENRSMRASVRSALERGLPCVAECGGFMYLTESVGGYSMVGFLPGMCYDRGRLTRFGYVTLTAKRDGMLCAAGETLRAHEFHYWDTEAPGEDCTARKRSGRSWDCVTANGRLYAGFPHFHFCGELKAAENFYRACLEEKRHG